MRTTTGIAPSEESFRHLVEDHRGTPTAIDVYTLEHGLIKEITAFVMPEPFAHFGLPAEVAL